MRALTVEVDDDGRRRVAFQSDYPKPTPGNGEVLVQVKLAGICGTDLHILDGYKALPNVQVLGHEFVGVIAAYGPSLPTSFVQTCPIGTRVVAEINCVPYGCASAPTARIRAQWPERTALGIFGRDGCFADFVTVPFENLHPVPHAVPDTAAVFTEPVAAACNILDECLLPSSATIAVLGAGRLGCLIAQVLAAAAHDVQLVARRTVPASVRTWGAERTFVVPASLVSETRTDQFDVVVDATGTPEGLATAIDRVKPRGSIILKSTAASSGTPVDLTPVVVKEIKILGSRCGPFPVALRLLSNNMINVDGLISDILPISSGEHAINALRKRGIYKVLLNFP